MPLANLFAMPANSTIRLIFEMIRRSILNICTAAEDNVEDFCKILFSQVHGTARPQSWRRDITQRRKRGRKELNQAPR